MTRYGEFVARKRHQYGDRFSDGALVKEFVPYFNSGARVRVQFRDGELLTGRIGVTTGWHPCFLLMRRSSDRASSWTIAEGDHVTAVQRGRTYYPVGASS